MPSHRVRLCCANSSNKIEIESTQGIRHGGIHNLCEHLILSFPFCLTRCRNLMPHSWIRHNSLCTRINLLTKYIKSPRKMMLYALFIVPQISFIFSCRFIRKLRWVWNELVKLKKLKFQSNRLLFIEIVSLARASNPWALNHMKMKRFERKTKIQWGENWKKALV